MTGRSITLLAALAAAPLAWAQPAPPALKDAPPSPPAAQAPAGAAAASAAGQAAAKPPPELSDLLRTRVEQIKRGNRVNEIRVTGAGGEFRYTMDVRDGRLPEPRQAPGTGVSTPNFLNIEF